MESEKDKTYMHNMILVRSHIRIGFVICIRKSKCKKKNCDGDYCYWSLLFICSHNYDPGKDWDCLTLNGNPGEPGVSSQGPLTNNAHFASVLGESGSPFTICSH